MLVSGQERLDGLNARVEQAQADNQRLHLRAARLESPRHIVEEARELGLIQPEKTEWLAHVPDEGTVDSARGDRAARRGPPAPRSSQDVPRRRHRLGRSVSGPYAAGRQPRLGRPPSSRATRRRLVGLCAAFFVMFVAVVIRLADVQVINPDRYVSQGVRQRFVSKQLPAGRGSVLDRNGVELALSLPQKSVFADPQLVTRTGHVHETAAALAPLLKMDVADLEGAHHGRRPLRAARPHRLRRGGARSSSPTAPAAGKR